MYVCMTYFMSNETHRSNFDIYLDHWNEQSLYFGNYGNQLMDIDKMFGSEKFKNQITAAGRVVL